MLSIFEQNLYNLFSVSGTALGLPPNIWLPPSGLYIKLNFDGLFSPLAHHTSIGGINKNASGLLVTA